MTLVITRECNQGVCKCMSSRAHPYLALCVRSSRCLSVCFISSCKLLCMRLMTTSLCLFAQFSPRHLLLLLLSDQSVVFCPPDRQVISSRKLFASVCVYMFPVRLATLPPSSFSPEHHLPQSFLRLITSPGCCPSLSRLDNSYFL